MNFSQESCIYKPRGQKNEEGLLKGPQHLITFLKIVYMGGGGQNCPKFCPRVLYQLGMIELFIK